MKTFKELMDDEASRRYLDEVMRRELEFHHRGTLPHVAFLFEQFNAGLMTKEEVRMELPAAMGFEVARKAVAASQPTKLLSSSDLQKLAKKDDLVRAIIESRTPPKVVCECGAQKLGVGPGQPGHSTWCPGSKS